MRFATISLVALSAAAEADLAWPLSDRFGGQICEVACLLPQGNAPREALPRASNTFQITLAKVLFHSRSAFVTSAAGTRGLSSQTSGVPAGTFLSSSRN